MRVRTRSGILPLALPLLLLTRSAESATVLVPQDQPTIQTGLDAAASGDTVLVACGTYFEYDIQLAPGVILRSETGTPECVVIDAQGAGRCLFGSSLPVGTIVEGVTITGGINNEGLDFGREPARGPGVPFEALAPSERDYGGGGGAYLILSSVTFRDCVFDSNSARVHAGGIRCEGGAPVFERCVFHGNTAGNQGGAAYFGRVTRPTLTDCKILDNTADYGGGIYAARPDALTCGETRFEGNHARVGAGGLHSSYCDPTISGCTFVANTAVQRGGGLAVFNGTAVISATTIALNDAPIGAGIRVNSATVNISESILALQTGGPPTDCVSSVLQLNCCDVWGNSAGDFVGCLAGQDGVAGNFSADPLFCAWPSLELGLLPGSPCLPANNSCGALIGSTQILGCGATVSAVLATSPPGLAVLLDGHTLTAPVVVNWSPDSVYTVGTTSPQQPAPDERHTFVSWSDGGAISHEVTAPDSASTLTASFTSEFLLTTTASPGGAVSPSVAAFYPAAAAESVLAIPDPGFRFVAWIGTGAGSYTGPANPAIVTMNGPVTQHADFELIPFTVTMEADSGGTVSPMPGAYPYPPGSVVQITATADSGWGFAGWTGSGTGSYAGLDNPATITVLGDITQTAHFVEGTTFTVTMLTSGSGTVTPSAGVHTYPVGTSLTISAAPDPCWSLGSWGGGGIGSYSGTSYTAQITVLSDITEIAVFVGPDCPPPPTRWLTMVADSGGAVSPPTGEYTLGSVVTVTATPDSGFAFDGWTGVGAGSYTGPANPATVTMDADIVQTAHFLSLPRYTLTMAADPGGTVSPATGEQVEGAVVTITATPDSGYAFTGWSGTGAGSYTGTNNPATVTVNEPLTQAAHFLPLVPLTMVADPGGTVTPSSGQFPLGTVVTIQADASPGSQFADWTGTGSGSYTGTANPSSVTMAGAITQNAHFFQPDSFPLTMDVSPPGTGTVTPGSGMFANGDSVVISAVPAPNFKFVGWLGTGSGSYQGVKQTVTIAMQDVITETAFFQELPKYTLTTIAGAGGAVTPATAQYHTGTQVTITAIPDSGNGFVRWSGQGFGSYSGPDSSVTITLIADVTETAFFEFDVPVTIATAPPGLRIGADGTDYISPQTFQWRNTSFHSVDVDSIAPGLPGERDRFGGWADGTTTVARTIDVPDTGITFTASYSPERFLDFVDPPDGAGLPGPSWHPLGAAVSIEGLANPGYVFNSWTGQGTGSYTGTNNPASVTMNEPLVQTPVFDGYGYEFSISASTTDPFVNSRPPTGGASAVYLWMTCTDVGIAAFEADVSSTVPYTGFNPAPGVLNAGGATNLLLAITGCPGAGGPYLVGTMNIADTGGEVCLVPSAASGRIGAVSCVAPAFLVDPVRVSGFSSSGQPPCFVPGTPCLLPTPADDAASVQAAHPAVATPASSRDAFLGAYPNPFLEQIIVRFSTAVAGPARLVVYDVTGRLVRTVENRTVGPGDHRTVWDGYNGDGARVPAGVYFVRLQAGRLDESRKIVLLAGPR